MPIECWTIIHHSVSPTARKVGHAIAHGTRRAVHHVVRRTAHHAGAAIPMVARPRTWVEVVCKVVPAAAVVAPLMAPAPAGPLTAPAPPATAIWLPAPWLSAPWLSAPGAPLTYPAPPVPPPATQPPQTNPNPPPENVPEPATIWLLLPAVFGLSGMLLLRHGLGTARTSYPVDRQSPDA